MGLSATRSRSFANTIWFILFAILGLTTALQISYCSPQNTGENYPPNNYNFQSNGHCQDICKFQYAYAVLQGENCWCSDYAPFQQENTGLCNVVCPGFPSELCGNQAQGLYGYFHLTIQPSGTLGAPASSSSQTPSPSSASPTTVTSTVLATVTHSPPPVTVHPTTTTTSSPAAITSQPGTTTLVGIVTTIQGSIQTVTVTSTIPPSAGETSVSEVSAPDPFWSSTAKVAGTFTVVAIVLVLLLVLVVFFCWKRFRSSDSVAIRSVSDRDDRSTQGAYFGGMTERRHSRLGLSTAGLGQGPHDRSPPLATPVSMSRRASQPMVHDQRLNPNALYAMGQEHGSRVSLESFQDDRDYSRPVLHVRNPDTS